MQVSGFFDKEILDNVRTYRWSGACGSLYLPGVEPGATLAITASAGQRPNPVEVKVSLAGASLGSFVAGPSFETFRLPLPQPLPPGSRVRATRRRPLATRGARQPRAWGDGGRGGGRIGRAC